MPKQPDYKLENKWSGAIVKHGWVGIPNLLLQNRQTLDLSISECYVLIVLETFRWTDKNAWPSIAKLAQRVGLSSRQVRMYLSSMETKGLLKRIYQKDAASQYDIEPLIHKLDKFAVSSRPVSGKLPPGEEETRIFRRKNSSAKENAAKEIKIKPTINTADKSGIQSFGSIAKQRYQRLEGERKSNDFGYEAGGQNG